MLHPQSQDRNTSPSAQASATGSLEAAHDAAWSRFNAAQFALSEDPGNIAKAREYQSATIELENVRSLFITRMWWQS
jgi:hypothetical protein